jgi:hypothetical protein
MSVWNHVILEAYCCYSWASKKKHTFYGEGSIEPMIRENEDYIPKSKRPAWCKKHNKKLCPQFKCLSPKCPFFAFCEADKKDRRVMGEAWRDMIHEEERNGESRNSKNIKGDGLYYNESREMLDETAIKRAGGLRSGKEYFSRAPRYGVRAWLIPGRKKNIVIWDTGNGWCRIIKELPISGKVKS